MENEPNPYAAPRVNVRPQLYSDIKLPLIFRQGFVDYMFLLPILLVTGTVFLISALAVLTAIFSQNFRVADFGWSIISLISGAAFVGSFTAAFTSVKVDSQSIKVRHLQTRKILFKDIVSWHYHPVTRNVVISLNDQTSYIVANVVMTKIRSQQLGKVLRKHVMPPG